MSPMFTVRPNPVHAGFDVTGTKTSIVMLSSLPSVEVANDVTRLLNETASTIEHTWQHVVGDIMEPIVSNWEVHIGPTEASNRGIRSTALINNKMVDMIGWLKLWLADAESIINDPVNAKRTDKSIFLSRDGNKEVITYGQVRAMLAFINEDDDYRDMQMIVGGTYRHADGGMYELVAIDVDHKGEDGEWRPGVLYKPVLNGVDGDTRMKTTTVVRWRERFVFAG